MRVFKGYANWVLSTVFSPDGKYVISSHGDNQIRFWDATSYQLVKELPGHKDIVRSLAIICDHNQKILASGSADRSIKLWDIDYPESEMNCKLTDNLSHDSWVRGVIFAPDDPQILASCSDDKTIKVWNRRTNKSLSLRGHTDPVRTIAFSPNGRYLISGSGDQTVLIWERKKSHQQQSNDKVPQYQCLNKDNQIHYGSWVWSVVFLDNETFAVGGGSKEVRFYEIIDSQPYYKELSFNFNQDSDNCGIRHDHPIKVLAYCKKTGWLASGGIDGKVRLWNFSEKDPTKRHRVIGDHGNIIRALAFSPNGEILLSGGQDGKINVWKIEALREDSCPSFSFSVKLPYDGTNIESCLGFSDYQEEILRNLGTCYRSTHFDK